jgi:hypothetical protein
MDVEVTVAGTDAGPDDLRLLRHWLAGEDELRGRTRLVEGPIPPQALGSLAEALIVDVGPAAIGVFASLLMAWLQLRTGSLTVRLRAPDQTTLEIDVKGVRNLDAAAVHETVARISRELQTVSRLDAHSNRDAYIAQHMEIHCHHLDSGGR